MHVTAALLLSALLAIGCGDDSEPAAAQGGASSAAASSSGGTPGDCEPGEMRAEDGSCRAAGIPPGLPAPGPTREPEAGVPPDGCAEGFAHDGDGGCDPLLPATPCAPGTLAIPGEASCHEVAPCGGGTYGDAPVDATTEHVDASYPGADSDGTAAKPWIALQPAIDAAPAGGLVALAAGTYAEAEVTGKAVRIWGRCPALVEIAALGGEAAIRIDGASGTEVHAVALTGAARGIEVLDSADVVLDALWIHDTAARGVAASGAALAIHASLIEAASIAGVAGIASEISIEASVVRATAPEPGTLAHGEGIAVDPTGILLSTLVLSASVVEGNRNAAIVAKGSDVDVDASVLQGTLPRAVDDHFGVGLIALNVDTLRSSVTLARSSITDNTMLGVGISGSDLSMSATTIRGVAPDAADGTLGFGLDLVAETASGEIAHGQVASSLVEDASDVGVTARGAELEATGLLVRGTKATVRGWSGIGVLAQDIDRLPGSAHVIGGRIEGNRTGIFASGSTVEVRESVIEGNGTPDDADMGGVVVFADGLDVEVLTMRAARVSDNANGGIELRGRGTIQDSLITDTRPTPSGDRGIGVAAVQDFDGQRATLEIDNCAIERNTLAGLVAAGADLDARAVLVRDTLPEESSGKYGMGIQLQTEGGERTAATIVWSALEGNHDAGLFVADADANVGGLVVRDSLAQPFDGRGGIGVAAGPLAGSRPSLQLTGCLIERARAAGVLLIGSDATLEGVLVRDSQPEDATGHFGRGITIQDQSKAEIAHSRVERCLDTGVSVIGSDAVISDTSVHEIAPRISDGADGDGISGEKSSVDLRFVEIAGAARAGVSNFSGSFSLLGTVLECNAIDLDGEAFGGPFSFDDLGSNTCGCDGVTETCGVLSAQLTPPAALPGPDGT